MGGLPRQIPIAAGATNFLSTNSDHREKTDRNGLPHAGNLHFVNDWFLIDNEGVTRLVANEVAIDPA